MEIFSQIESTHSGAPIYVLHELVHNRSVTDGMRHRGAIFVEAVSQVPEGSTLLLGAHGSTPEIFRQCQERHLDCHDATCPLVSKLQNLAASFDTTIPIIFLGDGNHPEVRGILERLSRHTVFLVKDETEVQALPHLGRGVFFSQTTRSHTEVQRISELLQSKVDSLDDQAHVCDAVFQRQKALETLAKQCDSIYILGSSNSSNARRLVEIAQEAGAPFVRLVEGPAEIPPTEFARATTIGLGAATSTPDSLIEETIQFFEAQGFPRQSNEK